MMGFVMVLRAAILLAFDRHSTKIYLTYDCNVAVVFFPHYVSRNIHKKLLDLALASFNIECVTSFVPETFSDVSRRIGSKDAVASIDSK
jgi:hypothetical protein